MINTDSVFVVATRTLCVDILFFSKKEAEDYLNDTTKVDTKYKSEYRVYDFATWLDYIKEVAYSNGRSEEFNDDPY